MTNFFLRQIEALRGPKGLFRGSQGPSCCQGVAGGSGGTAAAAEAAAVHGGARRGQRTTVAATETTAAAVGRSSRQLLGMIIFCNLCCTKIILSHRK